MLLLEGGGPDRNVCEPCPAWRGQAADQRQVCVAFETEPQETLKGRRIYWPRGKVLGGSSALNAAWRMSGAIRRSTFSWQQQGRDRRWSFRDLLPYFSSGWNPTFTARAATRGRDEAGAHLRPRGAT
ncbi:GMC family oxidoreductase N-terminal domain-containing protein [Ottowia sp.]|uniref:GMC family oxidoreductase N-terminal domain-containing protein n=1 Tax=Ottowia sp. TaxID=1898956 RepID=UPI00345415F0|nr:GMC family oxidoreductase N-terminal domain-containing protein [Ottowia sp.]